MDDFKARRTILEQESAFRIEDAALVRIVGGLETQRIAFADVRKVGLTYSPLTLFDRWVCSVEGHAGRIWLPSATLRGFGAAVDERAAFRAFVEALSAAIAAHPGEATVKYVKGNNWSAYGALAMLIVFAVMLVLLALGVMGAFIDGQGIGGAYWAFLPILVVLMAARMVWRIWRRNRHQLFDPRTLPADFAAAR